MYKTFKRCYTTVFNPQITIDQFAINDNATKRETYDNLLSVSQNFVINHDFHDPRNRITRMIVIDGDSLQHCLCCIPQLVDLDQIPRKYINLEYRNDCVFDKKWIGDYVEHHDEAYHDCECHDKLGDIWNVMFDPDKVKDKLNTTIKDNKHNYCI